MKLNNKGFSLVELLVAVVVLGFATGSVLHAFVTSSSITNRARIFGEATNVANNVQETIKSFSKEEFVNANRHEDVCSLLGIRSSDVYKINENEVVIKNVSSGSTDFDAKISFSRGEYNEETGGDGFYLINEKEVAQYTEMDGSFTQSWMSGQNPDKLSDNEYMEATNNRDVLGNPSYYSKTRLISVNIYSDEESDGRKALYADIVYNYTYTYYKTVLNVFGIPIQQKYNYIYTKEYPVSFVVRDANGKATGTSSKFIPTEQNAVPEIFIMYYPYYECKFYNNCDRFSQYNTDNPSKPESYEAFESYSNLNYKGGALNSYNNGTDLILINNIEKPVNNINCYIVKQRPVDEETGEPVTNMALTMQGYEPFYKAAILETFGADVDYAVIEDPETNKIYTNAGTSLITGGQLSGFSAIKRKGYWGSAMECNGTLVDTDKKERLYKTIVEIYPKGKLNTVSSGSVYTVTANGNPVYTSDGSKLA